MLDFQSKQEKVNHCVEMVECHIQKALLAFLHTHDQYLIKDYFTNTVLTPTETAKILAQTNLNAS